MLPDSGPVGKVPTDLEGCDDEADEAASPQYKEQAVARLLAPGATQASVAAELGVTPTQLKTWRLELEAAGSASAIERQQAEAGELARLRQDNKRLKEEVEVLRKASAFFAQWAAKT